jgi:hypothetical protein
MKRRRRSVRKRTGSGCRACKAADEGDDNKPAGSRRRVFAHPSRTGMTIPIVPEISPAARIKRSEPLHAVSDRVAWRRTVRHRRGRRTVVARTIVARAGQRAANDCPPDNASGNRRAPSPTSASPLYGCNTRDSFDDRKWPADRCRIGGTGEHNDAGGKYG